ncbi:MAG TPA: hypothetical protein VJ695_10140 [Nitrososphaera sp.]|nr:hypothetical protein [Nitrososphaera sp.]
MFTIAFFAVVDALKLSINPNAYTTHYKKCSRLQYHKAANIGRERAQKAQMRLFDYTGFAMLTYTIKQGATGFEPVGEEELVGKMTSGNESMLFICDNDGYAKAQSRPMSIEQAEEALKRMIADGMQQFTGEIKTVS